MDSIFTFAGYNINKEKGEVIFNYKLKNGEKSYKFNEKLLFPQNLISWSKIPEQALHDALNNLLIMLGISYWKLTCSKIELSSLKLSVEQAIFWETVYTKGLGEFFYKNNIDFVNLVHFPSDNQVNYNASDYLLQNRSLLFFGGGKDSIVAAEILKKQGKNFAIVVVNPTEIHKETLKILGKDSIFFTRIIDPQIFELNSQSEFYNGHVPATAINDFIGTFAAILYDYKYIISSNEKSASMGNVMYLGQEINHQWSKSYEFELMFSSYIKKFIHSKLNYFSILRGLSEIKIAEMFSSLPDYFLSFSSCNKNFKLKNPLGKGRWCCNCPKCLFVFILLSAFLTKEKIMSIFGKNLYEDKSLLPTLKELLGLQKIKPFECVGTPEETIFAMFLCMKKGEFDGDFLMDFFVNEAYPLIESAEDLQIKLLDSYGQNNIPEEFNPTEL